MELKNKSGDLAQGKKMKVSPWFLGSKSGFDFLGGQPHPPWRVNPVFGPLAVAAVLI